MAGSFGKSNSSSKSSNAQSFNQTIPYFQQQALTKLYDQANQLFKQNNNQLQTAMMPAYDQMSTMLGQSQPAWNQALQGGVYNPEQINQQLTNSLTQSLNSPTETSKVYGDIMGGQGNNYADAMKASYLGDANRATANMLSNLDARAAAAGMSGGARHGIATSQGLYDINSNLQKNLAQTGYDTFNQDLNNKLSIASQADQNTLQRQQMMQQMLGSAQDTSNQALTTLGQGVQNLGMGAFAPLMLPWQGASNYANIIGSPTVLSSGSGSGSGSGKSKGKSGSGGM
jgi:hypothetical protein